MDRRRFATLLPLSALPAVASAQNVGATPVLASWACDLNNWTWPEAWGDPPDWVKQKLLLSGRARYEFEKERYGALCDGLRQAAGEKECLRVHNVVRRKAMTESAFEDWYNRHYKRTK